MHGLEVDGWLKFIRALAYPATCLLCGAAGAADRDLCAGCRAALPWNHSGCPRCALPLAPGAPPGTWCGACRRRGPPFDRSVAPLLYQGVVPHLITGLKFHARMSHARLLGELLADALEPPAGPLPDAILPVPLHPARLRERGFNQALEIARGPARRLGVRLMPALAHRVLATPPQLGLDARARRRNLRGAFQVAGPVPARLALVDDVVTTGTTVGELARVLKQAGVRYIEVWAVARTD